MKTVELTRDYKYRPHPCMAVLFREGVVYRRVIEAAATAIVRDGAGQIVVEPTADIVDARHVWRW